MKGMGQRGSPHSGSFNRQPQPDRKICAIYLTGPGEALALRVVSWMFDRKGLLVLEKNENIDEDELMMLAWMQELRTYRMKTMLLRS